MILIEFVFAVVLFALAAAQCAIGWHNVHIGRANLARTIELQARNQQLLDEWYAWVELTQATIDLQDAVIDELDPVAVLRSLRIGAAVARIDVAQEVFQAIRARDTPAADSVRS